MMFSKSLLFTALLLIPQALLALPGLPLEPAEWQTSDPVHEGLEHDVAAQGVASRGFGPVVTDARKAAAREEAFAAKRALVGGPMFHEQGYMTGDEATVNKKRPGSKDEQLPLTEWPREATLKTGATNQPGDLLRSFDGIANSGWFPPDSVLGVGPSHVVEATNSGYQIYNRTGSLLVSYTSFDNFFFGLLPTGWQGSLFDPKIVFSPEHNKYVMMLLGVDANSQQSFFFIAVSQTSNPTGSWWLWRYDNEVPATDAWLDYSTLSVDTWGVYLSGNMFTWAENTFKWAVLWSIPAGIMNGQGPNGWVFWDLRWPDTSRAFSLQAAVPHSISGEGATFWVNSRSGSGNQIALWKLTGDRGNSPTLTRTAVGVMAYQAIGEQVDQPGSVFDIDGGDARLLNAVYSQRRVYTTLTTNPNNNGSSSGILSFKFNTDNNSLAWEDLIHSGGGWYYFYPAITVLGGTSQDPNIGIFLNIVHSDDHFPSVGSYVYDQEGPNSFNFVHFGQGPYVRQVNNRNRFGDYSGAAYDWTQPGQMWGAVEYASSVSDQWRTRIAAVSLESGGGGGGGDPCMADNETACMVNNRFSLKITWTDFDGNNGTGKVVSAGSDNSVLLWFFDPNNWEVLGKLLNGCTINNHFWFLAAATTNVQYTMTVTDTQTGLEKVYSNPLGNASPAIIDTSAFATCP